MSRNLVGHTGVIMTMLALSVPASAATVSFTGSFQNTNPPASATGRCAPTALTVNIGPSFGFVSGSSNLGSFTPSASHCINPPLPTSYSGGLFSFDFGSGDALTGSYFGTLSATSVVGVFANLQQFTATGGTGRFSGASGAFTGTGTVTFAANQLPFSTENITGSLNIPAVPEAGSWMMMIAGLGAVGSALRRRAKIQSVEALAVGQALCLA